MKNISNIFLLPHQEISFTYKDRHVSYVKGGRYIRSTLGATTNSTFLDAIEFNDYQTLQNLTYDNLEIVIPLIVKFIKPLTKTPKNNETWGKFFTMDLRS